MIIGLSVPDILQDMFDLADAQAKLDRANEHRHELDAAIRSYLMDEPMALSQPEYDGASGHFLCRGHVALQAPPRLGAILGDYVNNVRCALDYAIWALASDAGKATGKSKFPVCVTRAEFANAGPQALRGLKPQDAAFVEQVQPFAQLPERPEDHPLRILQRLSNIDKHRVLHPLLSAARDADPTAAGFRLVEGSGDLQHPQVNVGAPWQDGEPIVRVRLEPDDPTAKLEWFGQIDVEIVFGEARVRHEVIQQLWGIGQFVIQRLANDSPRPGTGQANL